MLGIQWCWINPAPGLSPCHSPHRMSAGGSLLFMRCVSLTLTGLFSAWRRGEVSTAILTKPLSDCVTVLCLGQCKSRHLRVCGILKRSCYFQTNWTSYILNWDVRCLCCRDAVSTCCGVELRPLTARHLIGKPPLQRKLKSAFANKNSSLI